MTPENYSELQAELRSFRPAYELAPRVEVIDSHTAGKAAIAIDVLLAKLAEAQFIASDLQGRNRLLQAQVMRLDAAHDKASKRAQKAENLVAKYLKDKGLDHE